MGNKILVGSNFNFKNRIINGDFSVWQRGTSFTVGGGNHTYTVDRFKTQLTASGQVTLSKNTLLNKNSAKITVNTAVTDLSANNYCYGFTYLFEGQHLYDLAINKKDVTISFWFNSNITGEYSVNLRNITDTSTNTQTYLTSFNYTTVNAHQKIEITIPLNAVWNPVLKNDENKGFQLTIAFANQGDYVTPTVNEWIDGNYLTTSTAVNWVNTVGNFIEIAELQLEEGNIATEFEKIPYDIQLQRCMRYYEYRNQTQALSQYANNDTASRTDIYSYIPFLVRKRSIPSINIIGYTNIDTPNLSGIQNIDGFNIDASCNATNAARLEKWIADAEL